MANRLNTILNSDWNAGICAKPSFLDDEISNRRGYSRVISSRKIQRIDELKGLMDRQHLSPESHDAFRVWVIDTTQAGVDALFKGIEEVAATYAGSASEKIIEWEGGDLRIFNQVRYEYEFIVFLKKSGIVGY